ncbi:MAG: RdgB/HAM1 family non-canonical purine NTP pyrophosphatase [Alphaproteobacteria bacterium]|nr:RdgB/HAM1 family non-canonical purine NTP pyrophosphatase [Alphaproteobacteria bacterium]
MTEKIYIASKNLGKIKEFKDLLTPLGFDPITFQDIPFSDIAETGLTFKENALLKAKGAFRETHLPSLADDSGLCIHALNNEPGIYAARFAKEFGGFPLVFDEINRRLEGFEDRGAHFTCAIALVLSETKTFIFETSCFGKIALTPSLGTKGFDYDPIFIPEESSLTFAELDADFKNQISHRAKALQKLKKFLDFNK